MGGKGPWRGRESAEPRLAPSPPASGDLGWEQRVAPHTPFSRGSESREPQDRSPPLPQSPLLGPQAARHSPRRTPQWALGVPNSAQLVGWSWSCTKQKQRGHGAAACRAEIPGRWHHRTRYMPSSQATLPAGKGRQAWPPNARPLSLPGGGPATPPRGTKLGAAGREASWPKTWYPDYRLLPGEARACPIPFHPGPASGAESREGHAVARHIPPRPPCPHAHCCQLEQKTHPQVAILNPAGSGPSADDRLRALLRPACRAAAGARGLGSS